MSKRILITGKKTHVCGTFSDASKVCKNMQRKAKVTRGIVNVRLIASTKTFLIGALCVTLSFAAGIVSNDNRAQAYDAMQNCMERNIAFLEAFPSYRYEDENVTISFPIPDKMEDAAQRCVFFQDSGRL